MNAIDLLARCEAEKISLGVLACKIEQENTGATLSDIQNRFRQMLAVMKNAVVGAAEKPLYSVSGLTGGDAYKYNQYLSHSIMGRIPALASAYALSCSETNAAMGRIVACPTAGSCGILPAAVLALCEVREIPEESLLYALAAAGLVGIIIDEHASLSGAQGGCQAECGSASAMAAAAVVELMGGTPTQCFDAAAITIKNALGLVCDPVAGLVEIPCIKRNVGGVVSALSAADLALAGVRSYIPFDDTVDAMNRVGNQLPTALRETAGGGLATTKTGLALAEGLYAK